MRCDVSEASGHVTTKPSICKRLTFYKLGVYARKVKCLTLGDLWRVEGTTDERATGRDRATEVSKVHSTRDSVVEGTNKSGSITLRKKTPTAFDERNTPPLGNH